MRKVTGIPTIRKDFRRAVISKIRDARALKKPILEIPKKTIFQTLVVPEIPMSRTTPQKLRGVTTTFTEDRTVRVFGVAVGFMITTEDAGICFATPTAKLGITKITTVTARTKLTGFNLRGVSMPGKIHPTNLRGGGEIT